MLRTLDILLIGVMTVAATITYSIKHRAEVKLEEVRKIEAEIRLEHDTIDLLRADWALLTQPARIDKLVKRYANELQLQPTESTQLSQAQEVPKLKADLTPEEIEAGEKAREEALKAKQIAPEENIQDVAKAAVKQDQDHKKKDKAIAEKKKKDKDKKVAEKKKKKVPESTDDIQTGSVKR